MLVVEAHHLVLDDLDLVLQHARALRDLVRVRPRDLLAKVVVGAIAENVDCEEGGGGDGGGDPKWQTDSK